MKYWIHHRLMALKRPFSGAAREKRMALFIETMGIKGGEKVIDLGGTPSFWADCPYSLEITIVNLPGFNPPEPGDTHHKITLIEGDACDINFAGDNSFDIAHSNSVIEHVGDETNQARLANEAHRLAPRYWVQTPSIWFPIEAHNNMPFWLFYPPVLKRALIRRWRQKLPAWTEMVEGTTVLMRNDIQNMFPDGTIWTERVLGFAKSYVVYRTSKPDSNGTRETVAV